MVACTKGPLGLAAVEDEIVDTRRFFDTIDHEWPMKFVEHRRADRRVLRPRRKWLRAGVVKAVDGQRRR